MTFLDPKVIGVIGGGRAGTAVGRSLALAGYSILANSKSAYSSENFQRQVPGSELVANPQVIADSADLILITTPDDIIETAVSNLNWHEGQAILHCSGSMSLTVLGPALHQGAEIGSFHPLQTFEPIGADLQWDLRNSPFQGIVFGIEAGPLLAPILTNLASKLGGVTVEISGDMRMLYHAGAVMVCGYLVPVIQDAVRLWEHAGLETAVAIEALLGLVGSTISNISRLGLEESQTGPVARGDKNVVWAHLESLSINNPELIPLYSELAQRALYSAVSSGRLNSVGVAEWRSELIEFAKEIK